MTEWTHCVRILISILMPRLEKEDQRYDQNSLIRPIPRKCTRSSVHAVLCTVSRRTVSNLRVRSRTAGASGYYNTYSTLYSSIRASVRANDVREAHRKQNKHSTCSEITNSVNSSLRKEIRDNIRDSNNTCNAKSCDVCT